MRIPIYLSSYITLILLCLVMKLFEMTTLLNNSQSLRQSLHEHTSELYIIDTVPISYELSRERRIFTGNIMPTR